MVDASLTGWGAALMQVVEGKCRPVRFELGLWNKAESAYDATKRECRAALYAFRRLRGMIYGIKFTLETDAQVLVYQLNGKANDVPGSLILRWISYLLLFDFEVRHVPGPKNGVADGLSRKQAGPSDQLDAEVEEDIEDFIDLHLNTVEIDGLPKILDGNYSPESERLARYLLTLQRPPVMADSQYRTLRSQSKKFFVHNRRLWKRARREWEQPMLVEEDPAIQKEVIRQYHEGCGHKGRDVTVNLIRKRYFWKNLWGDIAAAVRSCETCQKYYPKRPREVVHYTAPGDPFAKVHFDTQYMPND
ncbi:uncharacterized protein FFFS_14430 [Fusarium fujikuroi]|nr:uncharacterized protein FFFS_14430 [Fusarium fujikuroi]